MARLLGQGREGDERAWYTCVRHARPFREVRILPAELAVPRWFPALLVCVLLAGAVIGGLQSGPPVFQRALGGAFYALFFTYLMVSILDGAEHFRLEHYVTGRYLSWSVVPLSESIVHVAIVSTLLAAVVLARPLSGAIALRDVFVLASPVIFVALGWTDELVYHRRRALHREDILHTTNHIVAGGMFALLAFARVLGPTPP